MRIVALVRFAIPGALLLGALAAPAAAQVRVKDVVRIQGVRENSIYGYGIVMGLNGTGDRPTSSPFTPQTIANMLQRLGIALPAAHAQQQERGGGDGHGEAAPVHQARHDDGRDAVLAG